MLTHPQMLTKKLWKRDIREMKRKPKLTRKTQEMSQCWEERGKTVRYN